MRSAVHSALAVLVAGSTGLAQDGRMIAVDSNRALFEVNIVTAAKTAIGTVSARAELVRRAPLSGGR